MKDGANSIIILFFIIDSIESPPAIGKLNEYLLNVFIIMY